MVFTIHMSRIMAISPVLLGISGVMGAVLQAKKRFVAFALAPLCYNIGILIGITVFARWYGIVGVAWGVVLGAALHTSVQFLPAFQLGFRQAWKLRFPSEGVKRLLKMTLPRTASLAVSQVNLLIILSLASSLTVGSVAIFNLATNIQSLPFGLIGVSLAVASFPMLAQAVNLKQEGKFAQLLFQQLRWMWFLLAPITIWMLFLAPDIIYLVLGNGKFDPTQVSRLASVLRILAIAIPAQSFVALLVRGFYAKQNTWRPFMISVVAEVVNISLCLVLRDSLGLEGLAIAFTVSTVVNVLGLWFFLPDRQEIPLSAYCRLWRGSFQIGATAIAMIVGCVVVSRYALLTSWGVGAVILHMIPFILVPGGIYLLCAHLFGLEEPMIAWKRLKYLVQK
jgi:putative peptidoglycan lipid II flippase